MGNTKKTSPTPARPRPPAAGTQRFSASTAVGGLEFDFKPYGDMGAIPEPSSGLIEAFQKEMASIMKEGMERLPGETQNTNDPVVMVRILTEFLSADTRDIEEKILQGCAALCQDSPSFDQQDVLPYRLKRAWIGWLTGVFLDPEASAAATRS